MSLSAHRRTCAIALGFARTPRSWEISLDETATTSGAPRGGRAIRGSRVAGIPNQLRFACRRVVRRMMEAGTGGDGETDKGSIRTGGFEGLHG